MLKYVALLILTKIEFKEQPRQNLSVSFKEHKKKHFQGCARKSNASKKKK